LANDESTQPSTPDLAQERQREDLRLLRELTAARAEGQENQGAERDTIAKLIGSYDGYITRVTSARVFAEDDREDVAQGVRLRLARTLARQSTFDAPFFAVVQRSLNNEVVDYFRRRGRRREDASDQLEAAPTEASSDPAERVDAIGDHRLREALAQLSARDRELLGAKLLLGLSGSQMAERFAMSENNVNVRVHRALNKLRELLDAHVSEPRGRAD
jgi:RNA polymerase sigma factor (sigma-70 family)